MVVSHPHVRGRDRAYHLLEEISQQADVGNLAAGAAADAFPITAARAGKASGTCPSASAATGVPLPY